MKIKLTIEIIEGQTAQGVEGYVFTLTDTDGKTIVGDAFGSREHLAEAVAAAVKAHLLAENPDTAPPREPWVA
jgi:hypothetical protein